jgi:hypothetical protein
MQYLVPQTLPSAWVGRGQELCRYDTIDSVQAKIAATAALLGFCAAACAQTNDEPLAVFTEHPRLLLRPQRLRLLKRERERSSARWQQFEALVAGNAPLPERGFAWGLYSVVAGHKDMGRQAVIVALSGELDLRQEALVFDWCQDLMSDDQRKQLAALLEKAIAAPPLEPTTIAAIRSRVLAAIALYDHVPKSPQRELERVVRQWWQARVVPALKSGHNAIARDDAYPLWEMFHALRDNTNLDLRESVPKFFKDFPIEHLMSHYPATFEGPDNQYRIGLSLTGEPDLHMAALSRAAELEMVAFDTNAAESQVLQGWLMHDHFILRGTFGAPYEFLWANPYQPGLSYNLVPLVYHNPDFGKLFLRSSWEEDAQWFGLFDGNMQIFADGHPSRVNPQLDSPPISLTSATLCFAMRQRKFKLKLEPDEDVFLLGLEPKRVYQVEIDDEEVYEASADAGGILALDLPHGKPVGVRLREAP